MTFKEFIKMVFNRRIWFIVCALLCVVGPLMSVHGTYNEIQVDRVSFRTNPRYTYEINTYFATQTAGNVVEDYTISGYLYTPPAIYNLISPNFKLPAIVFMHGMIASKEIQYNIPRALAMAGFKVLAIDHPGHGDSGAQWDMGIQTLVGVYSAVDYLRFMCWDVDPDRIGVAGHSMGGIATTRAGIFDSWINPVTGDPIGTNGSIRACGAIYSWHDMLDTIIYSISTHLGGVSPFLICLPDPLKYTLFLLDEDLFWLFSTWGWLGNNQPLTIPLQMEARSVLNYINGTNIKNYMLVAGWDDQLTHPYFQALIMQNATIDETGIPRVRVDEIMRNVTGKFFWNYGNVTNGTGRRLILIPGTDHIREAFGNEVAYSLITWFHEAMDTGWYNLGLLPFFDPEFFTDFAFRFVGWIWLLIGVIGLIPVTVSYLSSWLKKKEGLKTKTLKSFEKDQLIKKIFLYAGAFIGFGVLGNVLLRYAIPAKTFTQFWVWDLVNLFTLFSAILQLPAILAIIIFEWKRHGMRLEDFGLSPKTLLRGLAIGILAFLPTILIYNPIAYSINQPLMLPRPFEADVYTDFFILIGVVFLQMLVQELLFRGLIQTKMDNGKRKMARWKTLLFCGLISGLVIGINYSIVLGIAFSSFMSAAVFLFFSALLILIFFASSILNGYVYQRTKNLTTSILISTLLLSFFEAGKLFLIYA